MRGLLLIVPVFLMFFLPDYSFSQDRTGIKTVVIDAGHGGKDPGAMGKKSQEKKITLSIALKLGELIKDKYPDVKVIYTRDRDVFVELHQRAAIANKNKADLFISIHCNANRSSVHHGAETYVMGLHKTEANLSIAKMENSSILMEPDYQQNYEGFDPNSDESYITFTLFQNIYLDQSTRFASIIQENLTDNSGLGDRGVRQAGFMVLYKTTMPSVLVEAGFLSNPDEEKFLISENGQNKIAGSIFRAFEVFKSKMDSGTLTEKAEEKKFSSVDAPLKEKSPATKPLPVKGDSGRIKPDSGKVKAIPGNKPDSGKIKPDTLKIAKATNSVSFRVQFALYPKQVPLNHFKGLPDVKMYRHNGMYKYTAGDVNNIDDALVLLKKIIEKGYKDAFVVAFRGEERITIEEARKLIAGGNSN